MQQQPYNMECVNKIYRALHNVSICVAACSSNVHCEFRSLYTIISAAIQNEIKYGSKETHNMTNKQDAICLSSLQNATLYLLRMSVPSSQCMQPTYVHLFLRAYISSFTSQFTNIACRGNFLHICNVLCIFAFYFLQQMLLPCNMCCRQVDARNRWPAKSLVRTEQRNTCL